MKRVFHLTLLGAGLALAASAADESKPELVSRTGGSTTTWSSIADLRKDAELGKPAALEAFGQMLLTGDQVDKDVPRALAMLERAAKAGQANAAFRLGKVYEDGDGVPRDPAKALEFYRQAAAAGVSEAQYNLGAMYVSARGVKRDYKEGLAWLILARKHGADASGEEQVRARLQSSNRAQIIPEAEARAAELEKQLKGAAKEPTATAGSAGK